MTGYVYIVSNPAMKEDYVKIGRTDRADVSKRVRELAGSGVPENFEIVAVFGCEDSDRLERTLHEAFDDKRVKNDREFFLLDRKTIEVARKLLSSTCMDLTEFFDVHESTSPRRKSVGGSGERQSPKAGGGAEDGQAQVSPLRKPDRAPTLPTKTRDAIAIALHRGDSWKDIEHGFKATRGQIGGIKKRLNEGKLVVTKRRGAYEVTGGGT